ncbi:MAG: T9SS type A sorting domain-containing protein [Flavobacteriales bacterium]
MKTKVFTLLILTLPLFCSSQILWDDFEQTRIGYYEFVHGGMTTRFENPDLASTVNSSELCAQYVRNPGELWDVLVIIANGSINDVSDYANGAKQMSVDVFSPAPGIPVQITLEDSSLAGATNYPTGRHSIYLGVTTLTNEWETIDLTFDSKPDPSMSDVGLTSVILLFNGNTNTNDTYYFDNLYGPEFDNQCDGLVLNPSVNFADWDCNWNLGICPSSTQCSSYNYVSGWLNQRYNPDNSTINSSKYSGEYTRNPDANGEDVLIAYFKNGALDLSTNKHFNFKLYGPPRPIYMSFQDASSNEVFSYNSTLTANNQWEQFSVDLTNVASQSITRFVLFLDQTVVNWDTYYLDDFNLSSMPLFVDNLEVSEILNIYPQPATNNLNIELKLNNHDENKVYIYDIQGNILLSSIINQNSNNVHLDVSKFHSGIYFVKVQSKNHLYTKKVQIIK